MLLDIGYWILDTTDIIYPINAFVNPMTNTTSPSHPRNAILAVDLGTSSARSLLVDPDLNIFASYSLPLTLEESFSGFAEQDPDVVLSAALEVIRQAANFATQEGILVLGICFSNAVSSLLALDSGDDPLGHALIWADSRSHQQVAALSHHAQEIYTRTGCPLHTSYWLPKLVWLHENQPDKFRQARRWLTIKDYVVWRLTCKFLTDFSNAAATGMLNLTTLDWDSLVMHLAKVDLDKLPQVRPTTFGLPLHPEVATKLGLPLQTPLILGAGDGALSSLGSGAVAPGQVTTMIGSSGACRTVASQPVLSDPLARTWSYPLFNNLWIIGGAENSGGLVVEWFQSIFQNDLRGERYAETIKLAAQVPPGCDGLIFLPYILGERAPIWDAQARGAFIGLDSKHTRAHLTRAVIEGTVYALFSIFQVLNENTTLSTEIRASGGYVRSDLWLQIQADMFGQPISVMENYEGSALGAAILGLYTLGKFANLQNFAKQLKIGKVISPLPGHAAAYRKITPLYALAYQQLKAVFPRLATLREDKTNREP